MIAQFKLLCWVFVGSLKYSFGAPFGPLFNLPLLAFFRHLILNFSPLHLGKGLFPFILPNSSGVEFGNKGGPKGELGLEIKRRRPLKRGGKKESYFPPEN